MRPLHGLVQRLFGDGEEKVQTISTPNIRTQLEQFSPLLELQDQRQLVEVDVLNPMHPSSYQSMVLGVDFFRREVHLDTPTPINPYNPIIVGDNLAVRHHCQGQILRFSGHLLRIDIHADNLVYVMALPESIGFQQRRFYPRLTIADRTMARLELLSPNRSRWYGQIKNISAGGLCVTVGGRLPSMERNTRLPSCKITIGLSTQVECQALVKAQHHKRRPYEHTELHLCFTEIGFQQRLRLQNTISFHLQPETEPSGCHS